MTLILMSVVGARLGLGQEFLAHLPMILGTCCIAMVAGWAISKYRQARSWPRRLMVIGGVGGAVIGLIWIALMFLDYEYFIRYENDQWYARNWELLRNVLFPAGIVVFAIGLACEAFAKPPASAAAEALKKIRGEEPPK